MIAVEGGVKLYQRAEGKASWQQRLVWRGV